MKMNPWQLDILRSLIPLLVFTKAAEQTTQMGVVVLVWILVALSHILLLTQAESMLRLNSGLRVIRGQSVPVTTEDLQFNSDGTSEACKVEVVLNEPVTQRVGKLTPQVTFILYSLCPLPTCHAVVSAWVNTAACSIYLVHIVWLVWPDF